MHNFIKLQLQNVKYDSLLDWDGDPEHSEILI
jgi:hypothetical protein